MITFISAGKHIGSYKFAHCTSWMQCVQEHHCSSTHLVYSMLPLIRPQALVLIQYQTPRGNLLDKPTVEHSYSGVQLSNEKNKPSSRVTAQWVSKALRQAMGRGAERVARGQGWSEGLAAEGQLKRTHPSVGTALCPLGGWWLPEPMRVWENSPQNVNMTVCKLKL